MHSAFIAEPEQVMLAYVYDRSGKLSLQDVPQPAPRADNGIIRVQACAVCGTDIRIYCHGHRNLTPPRIIGHEVCGTLTHVGNKIEGFAVGERVTVAPAIGCGACYACVRGYSNLCDNLKTIGFQYEGGFAEYMEIPFQAFAQGNVNQVEARVSDEEAALAEPIACALNGQELLHIQPEDTLAIWGGGFLGCMHAEFAALRGASQILIIARRRAAQVRQLLPNVTVINATQADPRDEIHRLTDGKGVDAAIIACSSSQAQLDALAVLAKRGRMSLFSGLSGESTGCIDSNQIHYRELAVFGAHASTPAQNSMVLAWLARGKLKVIKYVSQTFGLQDIEKAFHALQSRRLMKAIITPKA
jgi:L-iditol 2-dehydrogenase